MGIYEIKKPKRINSFSVTIFFMMLAIGYFGYFFIPVWWPIFQLTGIMKGICNDAYQMHDDEKLMQKLLKESQRTGLRLTKDNFLLEREPYSEAELSKYTETGKAIMSRRGKKCVLSMAYTSQAEWPFIGKTSEINWERSVETELSVVKY